MSITLRGTDLAWGNRVYQVADIAAAEQLVRNVWMSGGNQNPDGPQARSTRDVRRKLEGAATSLRILGAIIGVLSVAGGLLLIFYRDEFGQQSLAGAGATSILSGCAIAVVSNFAATFAEAWLATTHDSG